MAAVVVQIVGPIQIVLLVHYTYLLLWIVCVGSIYNVDAVSHFIIGLNTRIQCFVSWQWQ